MNKVAPSRQLQSGADPDVLVLFEDWLEELEADVDTLLAAMLAGPLPTDMKKRIDQWAQ